MTGQDDVVKKQKGKGIAMQLCSNRSWLTDTSFLACGSVVYPNLIVEELPKRRRDSRGSFFGSLRAAACHDCTALQSPERNKVELQSLGLLSISKQSAESSTSLNPFITFHFGTVCRIDHFPLLL